MEIESPLMPPRCSKSWRLQPPSLKLMRASKSTVNSYSNFNSNSISITTLSYLGSISNRLSNHCSATMLSEHGSTRMPDYLRRAFLNPELKWPLRMQCLARVLRSCINSTAPLERMLRISSKAIYSHTASRTLCSKNPWPLITFEFQSESQVSRTTLA